MIRGSCLCGGARFEIDGKVSGIGQCHCSICRKASGVASNAALLTATRSFAWVSGEELAQTYERPSGWKTSFCRVCGSPLPQPHPSGKLFWVPAGSLDDARRYADLGIDRLVLLVSGRDAESTCARIEKAAQDLLPHF